MTEDEIRTVIVDYLNEEFGAYGIFKGKVVDRNSSLTDDLRIDSDDLSFLFIPEIERRCGQKLSNETWASIHTVDQIARAIWEAKNNPRAEILNKASTQKKLSFLGMLKSKFFKT